MVPRAGGPLLYGRWNAAAQAHAAVEPAQVAQPATDGFYACFDPDPALPRRLAELAAPVLLVAGEYDIWPTCESVRRLAGLLGHADLAVLPQAGHFPWLDDPSSLIATVHEFLARLGRDLEPMGEFSDQIRRTTRPLRSAS